MSNSNISPLDQMGLLLLLPLLLLLWSVERSDGFIAAYRKPPNCDKLECPSYHVVHYQDVLEIRSYKKLMWMSTPLVNSSSYMAAADSGFMSLFNYIQGNNKQNARIEMTAPVLIDVHPSEGPFCNLSQTKSTLRFGQSKVMLQLGDLEDSCN